MSLNNILSQLGIGSRETVYLSVTPGVGLELIQLDLATKTVKNYACRPLEYNESLREISNMDAFRAATQELFAELKLNIKCNIILNLPMVLLGSKELPLLIGEEGINEALISEAEQSYIFKRYEPVVSWVDSSHIQSGDVRKLFYSAIQKNVIENIKNVLESLGATLAGVEISLTSILRALAFSGATETQMQDGISWNLMLVTQSGYSICSMIGKNLIEYYEEPLAIKSFEGDEIYNAIYASAQISLMSYPANYMYVVSETDMVSAEVLAARFQSDGSVDFLENNDFKKRDILPVSLEVLEENARKISLEAIGVAVGNTVDIPLRFRFIGGNTNDAIVEDPNEPVHIMFGGYDFEVSPNAARNVALAVGALIIVVALIFMFTISVINKKKKAQLDDIKSKIEQVESEINRYEDNNSNSQDFDVNTEIKKVLTSNRAKLMAYAALGESVPKNLWLTYFSAKDDGKIDIKGESSNVEDVYTFYRNMKDYLINTQLRLHKLELESSSVDDAVVADLGTDYQFEITNMTEAELNPVVESAETPPSDQPQQASSEDETVEESGLGKPLLNFGKGADSGK